MKVLVGEFAGRGRYVTRQIYLLMAGLLQQRGWRQILTSTLWRAFGSLKDKIVSAAGEMPEAVLFLEEYDFVMAHRKGMADLDCRKYFFADDLHANMETKAAVYSNCDAVISPGAHVFDEMYPDLAGAVQACWLPNSATPDFLLPFNENAENAIFLSGAINHYYPLRQRMKELYERRAFPITYLPHPGYGCWYDYDSNSTVGRGFAKRIHQHRVGFTDCLTLNYIVAKYFEIPAVGALLLADGAVSEPLEGLGLIAGEHYVAVSAEDLEEKLAYVLDRRNHAQLDRIRRAGQKLVWERHLTRDRVKELDQICHNVRQTSVCRGNVQQIDWISRQSPTDSNRLFRRLGGD